MSDKLQQAIAATRAGQKRDAQLLLTEALEENPNNEHAWFLLGNLVDSPEKRMAYLGKALTLNPQYEKAKYQYVRAQRQAMNTVNVGPDEAVAEKSGIPEEVTTAGSDDMAALPDWLSEQMEAEEGEEVAEIVDVDEVEVEMEAAEKVTETAVIPPTQAATKPDHSQQIQRYNYILIFLIIFIIVVLMFFIRSLF